MEIPSIVHPTTFQINGFTYRVISHCVLTDQQAGNIARRTYQMKKPKKKDQNKVFDVYTEVDSQSANMFG